MWLKDVCLFAKELRLFCVLECVLYQGFCVADLKVMFHWACIANEIKGDFYGLTSVNRVSTFTMCQC